MKRYRRVFVHAPSLADKKYVKVLRNEYAVQEALGGEICIALDWHDNSNVYHGPPPHLHKQTNAGLGYAPFGWVKGWRWMQNRIVDLVDDFNPSAIMYGEDPHVRNGWDFQNNLRDPGVAAYNDTLGIFREAMQQYGGMWRGILVIPETPDSNIQKRGKKRAREFILENGWDIGVIGSDEVEWVTDNGPPPDPEPRDAVVLIEDAIANLYLVLDKIEEG
jgi:hypothetical protein